MAGLLKNLLKAYTASFAGLPGAAWLLSLVVLINRSGSMVLFFMSLYLTDELRFSVADAGNIISVYGFGYLAGSFLGDWLSDKWGTSRVQLLSLALSGVGYIAIRFLSDFYEVAIAIFLLAVVAEAFRPANATALANVAPPEKRARAFALNRLAINLGITIGPALGGFLATLDYHYLFWVDGITSFAAAVIFYRLLFRAKAAGSAPLENPTDAGASPSKDRIFLFFLALVLLIGILFFQIFNTWPLFLRQNYSLLENQIGILLALNGFLIILLEMPFIHRVENRNSMNIISLGVLLLFGGFAILPLGRGFGYAAFTVIIWTLGEILIFPLTSAFIANRAPDSTRGRYMGAYILTYSLAFIAGPALGSYLYSHFGPTVLWSSAGVAGVIVFAGFLTLNRFLKREAVLRA